MHKTDTTFPELTDNRLNRVTKGNLISSPRKMIRTYQINDLAKEFRLRPNRTVLPNIDLQDYICE